MNPSTFRTNLQTLLQARTNLTDIDTQVFRYPPGKMGDTRPTIFLTEYTLSEEDGSLLPSSTVDRTYTFSGMAYSEVAGSQEDKWGAAEGTASLLMDELEATLLADQSVGTACTQARLASYTLSPRTEPTSHRVFMDVEFQISVRDVS